MTGWLPNLVSLQALALVLAGTAAAPRAEILPMTRERMAEADEVGRRSVYGDDILHAGSCRTRPKHGVHAFDVTITTPFAAVAYAVFEAGRKGEPLDLARRIIEPAGSQSVIVSADPAEVFVGDLSKAPPASVTRVVLRRGDQVIEARRADTHEVRFRGLNDAHRTYRGGAFYFPLEPFASEKGDLEIVVIPEIDRPGAEAVLKLKQAVLAKLR